MPNNEGINEIRRIAKANTDVMNMNDMECIIMDDVTQFKHFSHLLDEWSRDNIYSASTRKNLNKSLKAGYGVALFYRKDQITFLLVEEPK